MTPQRYRRLRNVLDRRQPDLAVLLDQVHKPHNLSAVLRTCDAVGVWEAHGVHPGPDLQAHEATSAGSGKWVRLRTHASLDAAFDHLRARGFQVLAAHFSERARDYREFDYTAPTAIILGAEKRGISPRAAARADGHVRIPMHGMVPSLNVSVAAAVILFEAERQRRAAGYYDRPRLDPERYARTLFEWGYPDLAAQCRAQGIDYPPLEPDGELPPRR
jgi:tRNA (guanosine-2'-O-)-methyltransferase